jgi:hypothetical protein
VSVFYVALLAIVIFDSHWDMQFVAIAERMAMTCCCSNDTNFDPRDALAIAKRLDPICIDGVPDMLGKF